MGVIVGTTKLLGVIGYPVEHSLSPVIHNAALAKLCESQETGLDYVYLPFAVKPENLTAAIAGFEAIDLRGFNLTIPHKQAILPLLSKVSEIAQAVGAVNTVWKTDQGWQGTNTDVQGFLAPLKAHPRPWNNLEVVILGNGGAARAVVVGCAQLGVGAIHVVGRDLDKLQSFEQSWNSDLGAKLQVHLWRDLPNLLPRAGLLVNTTPVGMFPQVNQSPLPQSNLAQLPPGAIAYDLIYTPNPTLFLQQAQALGLVAIDGLEMLVQQGAAALEIWLNRPVPVAVMGQAARHHLGL